MTRHSEKAPAAWQGHAGRDDGDTDSLANRHIVVELLPGVMRDVAALDRAGLWSRARERCVAALAEYRQRTRQRTVGVALGIDLMAGDVAGLVGIDRDLVRAVARETLLDSPLAAIARELRACRAEWLRHPKGRAHA